VIEKRQRRGRDGRTYTVYRVRWHDADGAERNKTLPRGSTRRDAEAFERRVFTLKRVGELDVLDRGRETLAEFAEEWWELYAGANLARATLVRYAEVWNAHTLPRLGHIPLRELTPEVITRFRLGLEKAGAGQATVRKALSMLQGMLARAVEWQRIASNPVAVVPKPSTKRRREVVVLGPERVEALRRHVLERDRIGDAVLISVLAYAGLRPWSEAVHLPWANVRERTLLVYAPKTRRERAVDLLAPLRSDLAEWRLVCGRPSGRALVFPYSCRRWTDSDVRNWRRRVWKPALNACELDQRMVPYDLRHSFASLLIHEKRLSIVEIAEQLGHAPTMTSDTYGHVMRELREAEPMSAEEQIRRARERVFGKRKAS
jgi:integrase